MQDRFWPDMLEPMINDIVKNNVQYYLDLYRPSITSKLEMDTFEVRFLNSCQSLKRIRLFSIRLTS
jgi:hypothetical protein